MSGADTATSPVSSTGQPLKVQSNEGFWGHLNPFARKKWVNRQVAPVKDRLNELDEVSAKNSADIKDTDARAQAGIHHAQDSADQANQQALAAGNKAGEAQQTADQASSRTDELGSTVSNLDQYSKVSDADIRFRPGQTILSVKAKAELDGIAEQLEGQKGYLVEVQGFSHSRGSAGLQTSQRIADSVVRYLVAEHKIPMYRIHQLAMGNAMTEGAAAGSVVHVTVVHNSLATLNPPSTVGGSPSVSGSSQSRNE